MAYGSNGIRAPCICTTGSGRSRDTDTDHVDEKNNDGKSSSRIRVSYITYLSDDTRRARPKRCVGARRHRLRIADGVLNPPPSLLHRYYITRNALVKLKNKNKYIYVRYFRENEIKLREHTHTHRNTNDTDLLLFVYARAL